MTSWRSAHGRRTQAPGRGASLVAITLVVAACTSAGGSSASPTSTSDSPQDPPATKAIVVRISDDLSPHAQARAIAIALDAGKTVSNVRVAVGSELRWKRPPSNVNIYLREHVVQPLVFGHHLYGYTVASWTGSHPAPFQKHDLFIQLLRTDLPLLPLPHRDGMPQRHIAITSLRRVPNHPLQGAMPYTVITSIGPRHEPPPPYNAAGLTRENHR
jgi:hypothetical protein